MVVPAKLSQRSLHKRQKHRWARLRTVRTSLNKHLMATLTRLIYYAMLICLHHLSLDWMRENLFRLADFTRLKMFWGNSRYLHILEKISGDRHISWNSFSCVKSFSKFVKLTFLNITFNIKHHPGWTNRAFFFFFAETLQLLLFLRTPNHMIFSISALSAAVIKFVPKAWKNPQCYWSTAKKN